MMTMINMWIVDGADCSTNGILLGVTTRKISPNNNTIQYLRTSSTTQ